MTHPIPDRIAAAANEIAGVASECAVLKHNEQDTFKHVCGNATTIITALVADLQRISNDAEVEVLTEADREIGEARAGGEAEWRPIDSAPKDGHRILMTGLNQTVRWTAIGYYAPAHGATWVSEESYGFGPGKLQNPTHWRPLPSPPAPAPEGTT